MIKKLSICIALFFCLNLKAQVDNSYINDDEKIDENDNVTWGFSLNSFNYLRNTEYFNLIESGRTLFGTQISPAFWVQPQQNLNLKLRAGVFLNQNFGSNLITPVIPIFSIMYQKNNSRFIFGTLNGATSHQILEPIFNINNAIEQRIEQGAQYTYKNKNTFTDAWINWQKFMPYKGNEHERFTAGLNFKKNLLLKNNGLNIDVVNQLILVHKGGQLSSDSTPQFSALHSAHGFDIFNKNKAFTLSQYILFSNNNLGNQNFGTAYMGNLVLKPINKLNNLSFIFTYFLGTNFNAINGTYIYQGYSKDSDSLIYSNRRLLFLRVFYDKNIFPNELNNSLNLSARFEPFADFNSRKIEFSFSLYVLYRLNAKLGKVGN
ncbi:MAG: hypothetical protein ACK4K9_10785 [Bacteroidia bacterium]